MNTVVRLRPTTRRLLDLLAKRNRWTLTEAAAYCVERATGVVGDDATSATSTSENQTHSDPAVKAVDSKCIDGDSVPAESPSAETVPAGSCAFPRRKEEPGVSPGVRPAGRRAILDTRDSSGSSR